MIQRHYDFFKNLAQIYLPGLGTLYFTLAGIWGLPFPTEIIGSIAAVDTFLGVILKISTSKWNPPTDGKFLIDQTDPEKDRYQLDIKTPLDEVAGKDHIRLDVTQGSF